jgi:tetratricopeptide (TPR) repeat protein
MAFNLIDRTPALLSEAKQAIDTATALQPDMPETLWALGFYHYWGLQDYDGGLDVLRKAHERLPNNVNILLGISLIEHRKGQWNEAIDQLSQAIALDPRNVALLSGLSGYYGALRQFDCALALLDKALTILPDNVNLIAAKAGTYQVQGDLDAADALLKTMPIHADGSQLYNVQIQVWLYRRRYDELIASLKAVTAQPDKSLGVAASSYFGNLGFAYRLTGRTQEAHAAFAEALKRLQEFPKDDRSSIPISSYIALSYAGLGDKESALREAERSVALAANDAVNKPQTEIYLAQVQGVFGENDAAIAAIPHLLEVPSGLTLAQLRLDPLWDPLRTDPRFQKIIDDGEKKATKKSD